MIEETRRQSVRTPLQYQSAGLSHAGKVRPYNEDAYLDRADLGLWIVADGVGGHHCGDYASQLIVDRLSGVRSPSYAADFLTEVSDRLVEVNHALRARATSQQPGQIIASTVVALLIFGMHFACVWAGDSRLYRLRGGQLDQITHDHSQVQEMVDIGLIDADGADRLPLANIITRAVGAHDDLVLDRLQDEVRSGDHFLLCSDGLSKMLTNAEIAEILLRVPLLDGPQALIDATLERGAFDNVTAVTVQCQAAG